MIRFLLIYLTIYSLAHAYAFHKIKMAFPLGRRGHIGIILFMAVMVAKEALKSGPEFCPMPVIPGWACSFFLWS